MSDVRRTLHDLAALAARVGVGGIFFANGWHKLEAGLHATGAQFTQLDAPMPGLWAAATMLIELVGGALLVAGLAVPVCGLLLFAEAVAVFVVASGDQGLPLTGGDVNLIVALGAASILLAVGGAGRLSVDHMVVIKRREAEAADDFAADSEADDVLAALREPKEHPEPVRQTAPTQPAEVPGDAVQDAPGDARRDPREPDDTVEVAKRQRTAGRTRPSGTPKPATPSDAPAGDPGDTLVAGRAPKDDKKR